MQHILWWTDYKKKKDYSKNDFSKDQKKFLPLSESTTLISK